MPASPLTCQKRDQGHNGHCTPFSNLHYIYPLLQILVYKKPQISPTLSSQTQTLTQKKTSRRRRRRNKTEPLSTLQRRHTIRNSNSIILDLRFFCCFCVFSLSPQSQLPSFIVSIITFNSLNSFESFMFRVDACVLFVADRVSQAAMATFELYRRSTIGMCLTETLDEMVQNGTLSPELAIQVLVQFDKVRFFFSSSIGYAVRFLFLDLF